MDATAFPQKGLKQLAIEATDFALTRLLYVETKITRKDVDMRATDPGDHTMLGDAEVMTFLIYANVEHGELEISVSQETYEVMEVGNDVAVEYQVGRWTGKLKGRIAR